MKRYILASGLIMLLFSAGCTAQKTESTTEMTVESTTVGTTKTTSSEEKTIATTQTSEKTEPIDLTGTVYTTSGEPAEIKALNNKEWQITYTTAEGETTATFETDWQKVDGKKESKTKMKKADGYSDFEIVITYTDASEFTIVMTDGDTAHEMTFTKQKPDEDAQYAAILTGDITAFEGQFSNDAFNKQIVDSNFSLGGYTAEDYYNNQTTVFPMLMNKNHFWNGIASHGDYVIKDSDLPKKIDNYYEAHFYGTNPGANGGEVILYLVPPKVKGPDGTISDEKRVFQKLANGELSLKQYQTENWWKKFEKDE